MNREELEKIGLTKEQIDEVMKMKGTLITEKDNKIEELSKKLDTVTTERDDFKTQLSNANTEIQSYKDMDVEGIKQKINDWETKYNEDTKALKEKLDKKDYDYKVKEKVSELKFTSESAKKAFISDLTDKGLKLENDNLLGFDDFLKSYKETDPGAFVPEEDPNQKTKPEFGSPTPGEQIGTTELDDFMEVMGITKNNK